MFAATAAWAVWEVGLNGWALVPRVVAPTTLLVFVIASLLVFVIASLPVLVPTRWMRRATVAGLVGTVVAGVLGVVAIKGGNVAVRSASALTPSLTSNAATADAAGADWLAYGGTYGARRYSQLAHITTGNVARLERAWVAHTGDLPSSPGDNR